MCFVDLSLGPRNDVVVNHNYVEEWILIVYFEQDCWFES